MNKYVLEKKYSLLHPLRARDELKQLRLDLLQLEGFGEIHLIPVFYEQRNKYELVSEQRGLEGHLQIWYFIKDVSSFKVRVPRVVSLDLTAHVATKSLDEFVEKYKLARTLPAAYTLV